MRMLVTLTAAALATIAFASSAFAESTISCESSLPVNTTITATNCRAWGVVAPIYRRSNPTFAYAQGGAVAARGRAGRTGVYGGAW
jgi:hypothetical protein